MIFSFIPIDFTNEDYAFLRERLNYKYISARYDKWGAHNITYKNQSAGFSVKGVTPHYRYIENTQVLTGRYINEQDIQLHRKVCMLGKPVAEHFFGDKSPIGERVAINDISYKVVGTFYDDGGDNENRMVNIPVTTAQIAYSDPNRLGRIMLMMNDGDGLEESHELEKDIRRLLSTRLKFAYNDPWAIHIRNNFESFKQYNISWYGASQ